MLLLLIACTEGGFPPIVVGKADTADTAWPDSAPDDSAPDDSAPDDSAPDDSAPDDSAPGDWEVCYLGADRSGTTCLPVVEWQASWGEDYEYPEPMDSSGQYDPPLRFIDLEAVDAGLDLAPNFALGEFMQAYKGRYAIFQPHAVERLQDLRDELGGPVVVNSAYRNVTYNAGVGGATWSRHMYGDAADIAASGWGLEDLGEVCTAHGAGYIGYYESHVHCDWRDDPLEPAFFAAGAAGPPAPASAPGRPQHAARLVPGAAWTAPAEGWDEGEPLREWTALGPRGEVLAQAEGRSFTPPPGAAQVTVVVGRVVHLNAAVR